MKNYQKIISIFVIAFGLFLIPKVSFAKPSFDSVDYIDRYGYSYHIDDISVFITDWNSLNDNQIIIGHKHQELCFFISSSSDPDPYLLSDQLRGFGSSCRQYNLYATANDIILGGTFNPDNLYLSDRYFIQYWYTESLGTGSLPYNPNYDFVGSVPNYLHIIGDLSNCTCNISNGNEITENIVVTAQEDYYFTNVQNGFVLFNNDTIATYDITDLTGDFNLVATDFVTDLIGSDDPPVDPPVDPPTDDPIIIGDYTFISSVPIANEFKDLFSSAIDIFKDVIPYAIGLVGLGITISFIICLINKS